MPEERGPSYWDVSAYVDELRVRWGVNVLFRVFPPIRIERTGGWTSWRVEAEVWRLGSAERGGPAYGRAFGKGGAYASAPAAMHAVLRDLETWYEERERAAESKAAF